MTLLSVVLPVFNEAAGVAEVIADIRTYVLDAVVDSDLVVIDDASTDATASVLAEAARLDGRILVYRNQVNVGHGPTMRRGMDVSTGEWIFHLDSDGQVDVAEFGLLWAERQHNDLVLGVRVTRDDPRHRRVLTRFTRVLVSLLGRTRVRDANVPFKLTHRSLFDHLAPVIPDSAFAPSILLVLGAHRVRARVAEVEISHLARMHGRSHLRVKRLAGAVGRSTLETLRFSRRSVAPYERG